LPRVPVEVRRCTVDDVEEVLALWREARADTDRSSRPMPVEQLRPRLTTALARGEVEVLLARWDGRPAGFVVVRIAPLMLLGETPAVHVEHLFVTPELRRHGIARALLSGVVARAERECADQIVTGVPPWARDTHRFFARLGFTPLVVRRTVATGLLRRRLAGESARGAVDDLLSRRRSLRARARLLHRRDASAAVAARAEAGTGPVGKIPAGKIPAGKIPAGKVPAGKIPIGKVSVEQQEALEDVLEEVTMNPAAVDTATIDAAAIAAAALDAAALDEVAYDHR
jgi:GNAT superfamily N-acetyltransferase